MRTRPSQIPTLVGMLAVVVIMLGIFAAAWAVFTP